MLMGCCSGHDFLCCDGVMRRLYVRLAVWAADLVEAASLFMVRGGSSSRPDVNYLIERKHLADVDPLLEPRTEKDTLKVSLVGGSVGCLLLGC